MYPDAYAVDTLCASKKSNTLGNFSMAYIPVEQYNKHGTQIKKIFNLYGQNLYGKGARQTNYDALYNALEGMSKYLTENDMNLPICWISISNGKFSRRWKLGYCF